ncbi:MAG: carbohydrate ABC transporter permease [Acetobacteraceae bacterium]
MGVSSGEAAVPTWRFEPRPSTWITRLFEHKPFLVGICLLPAVGFLVVFLTYPLGLGFWLSLTDSTIGQRGHFVGLANYISLIHDPVFRLAVLNTIFYTTAATIFKFGLGVWLAMLLNNHLPFKAILRAAILLPWIVPTTLSAIVWWWMYSPQFSIISYFLVNVLHVRSTYINFLGSAWPARWSLVAANVWRGIPFVAIIMLAGLQTVPPSLYEAALLDGASPRQRFRYITVPLVLPILSVALTLSTLFTFSDFQLVYAITRGGPFNSTQIMATLAYQRAINGTQLGQGAAIAMAMIPFLVALTMINYLGLARRKWQQGGAND